MSNQNPTPPNFTLVNGCLIATLPPLALDTLRDFGPALSSEVQRLATRSVLIDCALVEILDSEEFCQLRQIIQTLELLGARCVVASLRAGVVAHLVNYNLDTTGLEAVISLEDGLVALRFGAAPVRRTPR